MNRQLRIVLIVVGIVAALGVLGYITYAMDLPGILISLHTQPQH